MKVREQKIESERERPGEIGNEKRESSSLGEASKKPIESVQQWLCGADSHACFSIPGKIREVGKDDISVLDANFSSLF